jgi:hypothetical protein
MTACDTPAPDDGIEAVIAPRALKLIDQEADNRLLAARRGHRRGA